MRTQVRHNTRTILLWSVAILLAGVLAYCNQPPPKARTKPAATEPETDLIWLENDQTWPGEGENTGK